MSSPETPAFREAFAALAVRDFRRLWFGVLCMMGGLSMAGIARGYLTYEITGSPILLGLVNAGFAVPMLALSLFGGAAADRIDRKKIIGSFQGLGALTALAVAISISIGAVTWVHLFVASVINGVVFSFMVPARNALIPHLVSDDLASNALALNAAAMSVTTLLGPAVAGLLYAWIGPGGVYYVIAGLQLTAMVSSSLIKHHDGKGERQGQPILGDIKAGIGYIRRSPLVMVLLFMGLVTALLAFPFRSLLPVFIVDVFHRESEALGLLVSAMGIGAIAGSLGVAALPRGRRGLVLIWGALFSAIALGVIAAIPRYGIAVGFMVLLGLGDAIRRALNMALIIEITDTPYRGRVISFYTMNFGLMPLGTVPTSIVAEFFGIRVAIAMLAALLLLLSAVMFSWRKDLRDLA